MNFAKITFNDNTLVHNSQKLFYLVPSTNSPENK